MQVEDTRLYRVKAVAELFAVSPSTVYREIEAGKLTALRVGNSIRVTGQAISAYLVKAAVLAKQVDGLACVVCGRDFYEVPSTVPGSMPHVPVGVSGTGSQVFACREHADQTAPFVAADEIANAEV